MIILILPPKEEIKTNTVFALIFQSYPVSNYDIFNSLIMMMLILINTKCHVFIVDVQMFLCFFHHLGPRYIKLLTSTASTRHHSKWYASYFLLSSLFSLFLLALFGGEWVQVDVALRRFLPLEHCEHSTTFVQWCSFYISITTSVHLSALKTTAFNLLHH